MVDLRPLSGEAFPAYRQHSVRHYAQGKVDAGVWSAEEAERRAAEDMDGALPDGAATKGHFLYGVEDPSLPAEVGKVWFAVRDSGVGRVVWIYDIEVHEEFRRRGYGAQTLEAVEEKARELGADSVELHVFGHNESARALYAKLGYDTQSIVMSRRLDKA